MEKHLYYVHTRHAAEECEQAFEDWERLRKNQKLPIDPAWGYCFCPFGDHSGFLIVGDEKAAKEIVRIYRGQTTYRPVDAFPFAVEPIQEAR